MSPLNWFTRRIAKSNRTILTLDALEAREVPAAFNLTTVGATATINGALFSQYSDHAPASTANRQVNSFLRMDSNGREEGYNTDGRLEFDENNRNTHSIRVADLPLVTKGGVQYRELILDVNEPRRSSVISLDELRVYVSNSATLRGYNERNNTIGGRTAVFDLDAGRRDNFVRIDAGLNNRTGTGDMVLDIPADLLSGGVFLTLYSKFGGRNSAGGGYEQWGPGFATAAPPAAPTTGTASLSGMVLAVPFGGVGGVTITLTGLDDLGHAVSMATVTDGDGNYSFTNLRAGTYTIIETQPIGYEDGTEVIGSVGGAENGSTNDQRNDEIFDIHLGNGGIGSDYNFNELAPEGG